MKKYAVLFIVLALAGCANRPTPTATPVPVVVRTVIGDQLPDGYPAYPTIDLGERAQWEGVEALLISKELMYKAGEDTELREQLQSVIWEMVLLIIGASTQEVRDILQMPILNVTSERGRSVMISVRATETNILGSEMVLLPESKRLTVSAKRIDDYVRHVQEVFDQVEEK